MSVSTLKASFQDKHFSTHCAQHRISLQQFNTLQSITTFTKPRTCSIQHTPNFKILHPMSCMNICPCGGTSCPLHLSVPQEWWRIQMIRFLTMWFSPCYSTNSFFSGPQTFSELCSQTNVCLLSEWRAILTHRQNTHNYSLLCCAAMMMTMRGPTHRLPLTPRRYPGYSFLEVA